MKISVLIPTRQRTEVLYRGVDSVIDNAKDKDNLELIFRFDDDDDYGLNKCMEYYQVTPEKIDTKSVDFKWGKSEFRVTEGFSEKYKIFIKFIVGKRHGYVLLNRYYDELIHISTGEYLVIWTDDFELLDNPKYDGWDSLMQKGSGQLYIFMFRLKDGGRNYFPRVVPKKFWEINGQLCPNVLDDWWYRELCKIVDCAVILDWDCKHHCQVHSRNKDLTTIEGRIEFSKHREKKNLEEYRYYSLGEIENIKKYLDNNPNTEPLLSKDNPYFGKKMEYIGPSGRWHSDPHKRK